jgi:hypothetical protein
MQKQKQKGPTNGRETNVQGFILELAEPPPPPYESVTV